MSFPNEVPPIKNTACGTEANFFPRNPHFFLLRIIFARRLTRFPDFSIDYGPSRKGNLVAQMLHYKAESCLVAMVDPLFGLKHYRKGLILAVALAVLYGRILYELASDWWNNPDYSHGLILPFITAYLIWRRRGELTATPPSPSILGLLAMLGAVGLLFTGELGAEFFLTRISFLIFLAGLILFFRGWKHLQMLAFPVGLLLLAIPLPAVIFYQLTFPLQLLASSLGALLLEVCKVPVVREGNLIMLPNITLEVVDACSGIRSLFSLTTLTILYGYFLEGRTSFRLILVGLSVPLALFCNGLRIMGTGVLTHYMDLEAAEGFFHTFSGWFLFLTALTSLFLIHRGLDLFQKWQRAKK